MRKKLVNSLIAGTMLGMLCALPVFAETETVEGVTGQQSVSENSTETVSGNDIEKGDIAIDGEHFPDETFRNYVSKNFDNDEDGKLSGEEIDNVTEMDVSESGIESLKGIEYFSKLTALYCYKNELTSLNVSNNTALEYLNCGYNRLTGLDVSKNTALTELYCWYNQLSSLDVSKNTKLWFLHCEYNQLSSLDVSHNTMLYRLYCYVNQLTSLDVSQNTALTELNCWENQLTSLDVSKNMALTLLYCSYNRLTGLDVSKNTALTYLDCSYNQLTSLNMGGDTALAVLSCSDNQLSSLDVSQNTALRELYCSWNQLDSLDVGKNTALKKLVCDNNQLTSLDISNCKYLTETCQKGSVSEDPEEGTINYEYSNYNPSYDCFLAFDKNVTLITAPQTNPNPNPVPNPDPTPTPKPGSTPTLGSTQTSTGTQASAPVVKKANTVKVTVKTPSVKAKNKKQTISASKIFKVSKAQGKISYKKVSGSKNLTISKTGKITVKKGTKAGTYKIKVAITAAGNENYKAKTVNKTVKVKVKK